MDEDSLIEVDSKEYIKLSCKEITSEAPDSSVVWLKDGVEMTHSVRTFYATHN